MRLLSLVVVALVVGPAQAQLTIEQITQRPETWVGAWPSAPYWTDDGEHVYFQWNPQGEMPGDSLFRAPAAGGAPERVEAAARRALAPRFEGWGDRAYAPDRSRHVVARDGDLYLHHLGTGRTERLTRTVAREGSPLFLADGSVVYRQGNDLFRLADGAVEQLTDIREGAVPSEAEPSEAEAFLRDQQRRLLGVVREGVERDSLRTAQRERDEAAQGLPTPVYVGAQSVRSLDIDPAGRFVLVTLGDDDDRDRTVMTDYVTASGAAETLRARAKVGGERAGRGLRVLDLERDTTVEVSFASLPGAFDPTDVARERGVTADSSRLFLPYVSWSPDGRWAIVDVRTVDNKDRWIARLDPATGALVSLDRQRDEAWIGGPGIPWGGGRSVGVWMPDGRYAFQSERTGWSHLYAVDPATGETEALTAGAFEVSDPTLTPDGRHWIFQSSEGDLAQRHIWRMPAGGGAREPLTEGVGRWDAALSPDGRRLALLHSRSNRPPEVYVQPLGGAATPITDSPTDAWRAYPWRAAEIVAVPASDGARVPARIYRPETPNGAAVVFVHGAGYLQNAHRWWSGYHREYQFHHLLAERGYLVLDLDYRASAGYGRDWRTAVYRHMGGRDLQDYVDASRWLGEAHGIDPERVAIYGGSYGGFITLMALFTEPEHFGGGAALRSVTDWAHYNDVYTRNILNTPVEDPEAYRRSSPIEFAEGLEDPLLMTHGLVDTNVQPQDIFRLSQRLIELGKRDWELAIAPVEPHGYTEPSSWADKLARILDLIEHSVGPDRDTGSEG